MDSLVVREKDELRRLVEVEAVIELLLPQHGERRLAGFGMRYLRERLGDLVCKAPVSFRSDDLAEIDLAAVPEAVGASSCKVDLHERRLLVWKLLCEFGSVHAASLGLPRVLVHGSGGSRPPRAIGWRERASASASCRGRR